MSDPTEKAERIIKMEGLTFALAVSAGSQGDMREARQHLQAAIASALQDSFDLGFRAAGGTITKLTP